MKILSAKDILRRNDFIERVNAKKSYISEEFQDFGYRLAVKLDDLEHKSLYIKFAKDLPRDILNDTMEFTLDYPLKSGSRAKIFMWKLYKNCQDKGIKMPARIHRIKKKKIQLDLL